MRRLTVSEIAEAAAELFIEHRDVHGLNELAAAAAVVQDALDAEHAEAWGDDDEQGDDVLDLAAEQGTTRDRGRFVLAAGPAAEPYVSITRGRQLNTDEAALAIDYGDSRVGVDPYEGIDYADLVALGNTDVTGNDWEHEMALADDDRADDDSDGAG